MSDEMEQDFEPWRPTGNEAKVTAERDALQAQVAVLQDEMVSMVKDRHEEYCANGVPLEYCQRCSTDSAGKALADSRAAAREHDARVAREARDAALEEAAEVADDSDHVQTHGGWEGQDAGGA